jgi:Rieske Fe-S protein
VYLLFDAMKKMPRSDFLDLASDALLVLGGLLVIRGLGRFFSFQIEPDQNAVFELGDGSDIPPGSSLVRLDIPAVIFNCGGEFSAFSLTCPHLGCTVETVAEGGFTCPCHGSRFKPDGLVIKGPATRDLRSLQIKVDEEGKLWVDTR